MVAFIETRHLFDTSPFNISVRLVVTAFLKRRVAEEQRVAEKASNWITSAIPPSLLSSAFQKDQRIPFKIHELCTNDVHRWWCSARSLKN